MLYFLKGGVAPVLHCIKGGVVSVIFCKRRCGLCSIVLKEVWPMC